MALRGNEIFMVEAYGLYSHLHLGSNSSGHQDTHDLEHVVIPLLGKFKNEDGSRYHLMLSCNTTKSGLEVRKWVT